VTGAIVMEITESMAIALRRHEAMKKTCRSLPVISQA
jgi:hypothetical protein